MTSYVSTHNLSGARSLPSETSEDTSNPDIVVAVPLLALTTLTLTHFGEYDEMHD